MIAVKVVRDDINGSEPVQRLDAGVNGSEQALTVGLLVWKVTMLR